MLLTPNNENNMQQPPPPVQQQQPQQHRVEAAAAAMTTFWTSLGDAIHSAQAVGQAFGQVALPAGCHWLGLAENGGTLLVRASYRTLWAEVQAAWQRHPQPSQSTLIIGTPGIGQWTPHHTV